METLLNAHINTKLQSEYQHIVSRVVKEQSPLQKQQLQQVQHSPVQRQLQNIQVVTETPPANKECPVQEKVHRKSNGDVTSSSDKTQLGKTKKFKPDGYLLTLQKIKAEFYAFSNADIIFTDSLGETLEAIGSHNLSGHVYITGQRSDVKNVTRTEAISFPKLTQAEKRGELHIPFAEDYFITDRKFPWERIPELVIGRQYYDNWMSYNARMKRYWAVDATSTILAVHQTVDRGSFEHRILKDQKNRFYNFNLLMNKTTAKEPNFESGLTTCLEYFTTKSIYNEIIIAKRQRLPDYCDLNGPRHRRFLDGNKILTVSSENKALDREIMQKLTSIYKANHTLSNTAYSKV
ncbi:hypothetical protein KUTeg_005149 [Tegillarca granosa]|uniref:Uncharacterized protein n=1 Tax=Tegillarca granosa TaxID=220873 RepID=A0ABQ9FLU1_TEGGR|nr:hypothetical protein KUTeg_005149 [Tegillarca granosa]